MAQAFKREEGERESARAGGAADAQYPSRESHFNKAVPPLREAYLLTLPHGEDEDGVGGADVGSLAHMV
jgi:hypothetical protein